MVAGAVEAGTEDEEGVGVVAANEGGSEKNAGPPPALTFERFAA